MSSTPAWPCTTTALLWQNSLWWISTPSATCLSTVAPSACGLQPLVEIILADRLKRLVKSGLLTREDTRPGQRARYSLTEPAIQLVPVFAQLGSWGLRHRPTSSALNARAELLEQGGPALWQEFMHELRRSRLGSESPARSPSVRERLNAAYLAATNSS